MKALVDQLTDQVIEDAKLKVVSRETRAHEHPDCIRIAFEWLDAQKKMLRPNQRLGVPLKHIIESWGQRYVSQSDVEVAAYLHPDVIGSYPFFNLSSRLTKPSGTRLVHIGEAGKHQNYDRYGDDTYKRFE